VTAPLTGVAPAAAPAVLAPGVPAHPRQAEVLTPATLTLVADLHRAFAADRAALLAGRRARRERIAATGRLDFLAASRGVRDDPTWRVRPAPPDLQDRRLMEDVATAEISRSQVWQWLRAGTTLDDGTAVTAELVRSLLGGQVAALVAADPAGAAAAPRWEQARGLFEAVATSADFVDFLTLPGYGLLP
jgi:malate synthase